MKCIANHLTSSHSRLLRLFGTDSSVRQIGILCFLLLIARCEGQPNSPETSTSSSASTGHATTHHTSRNCTSRVVGNVYLPCQPDNCFYRNVTYRTEGGHVEPCMPEHHEVMTVNHYSVYKLNNEPSNHSLLLNRWVLLKNSDGECMNILAVKPADTVCMLPGFCDSNFPWYLRLSEAPSTTFGVETQGELCMTDVTSLEKAVCCRQPIRVRIRSCGFYWIYNIVEPMPVSSKGYLCVQNNNDIGEGISSLNIQYTVEDRQIIPKRLDELTDGERNSLCTVIFKFSVPDAVEIPELVDVLNSQVVDELNKYLEKKVSETGERQPAQLTTANIYRVVGSPDYIDNKKKNFYYTIYAGTDSGELISQSALINAIDMCDNTKFSQWYAYVYAAKKGISSRLTYPYISTTLAPVTITSYKTESSLHQNSDEWKIIIYIIIATFSIIIIAFLFLCIYRLKLLKSLRSNRNMPLSKLDRWLLCEKYSTRSERDLPLKQDGHPVLLLNGNCNGNGKFHIQLEESETRNKRETNIYH